MASSYTYALSAFTNATALNIPVDPQRLTKELATSSITTALFYLNINAANVVFTFVSALTAPQITTLNGIVAAHPNNSVNPPTTFTTNPTVNDDESKGYFAGDLWINYSTKTTFRCINGYKGQAEWVRQIKLMDELSDVVITGATASNILQYNGSNWVNVAPIGLTGSAYRDEQYAFNNTTAISSGFNAFTSLATPTLTTSNNKNLVYYLSGILEFTESNVDAVMTYGFKVGGTSLTSSRMLVRSNNAGHYIVASIDSIADGGLGTGTGPGIGNGSLVEMEVIRQGLTGTPISGTCTILNRSIQMIGL